MMNTTWFYLMFSLVNFTTYWMMVGIFIDAKDAKDDIAFISVCSLAFGFMWFITIPLIALIGYGLLILKLGRLLRCLWSFWSRSA